MDILETLNTKQYMHELALNIHDLFTCYLSNYTSEQIQFIVYSIPSLRTTLC